MNCPYTQEHKPELYKAYMEGYVQGVSDAGEKLWGWFKENSKTATWIRVEERRSVCSNCGYVHYRHTTAPICPHCHSRMTWTQE